MKNVNIPEGFIRSNFSKMDEVGVVLVSNDKVLRAIRQDHADSTKELLETGLVDELVRRGLFPETRISDLMVEGYPIVLEHKKISPLVYPFEWSPEMLRRAALCVLAINRCANEFGYELKDAHPYNVLFSFGRAQYVDFGSLVKSEFEKKEMEYEGKIVIAASHAIVDAYLSQYIAKFRTAHPAVLFHLEGGIFEMVFEKVESGEVGFGIAVYGDPLPKTMISHDLFEADVKLIAPKNNAFFPGKFPTLKQIAKAPLILFTRTGKIDPFIERPFGQEQLKPNVVITHNNFSSVKKYVAMGMGVAILGGYTVYEEDERLMDVYPLDRYYPKRKYGLLLRKRKYLSPAVKGFIQTIRPDIHSRNEPRPGPMPKS